MRKKLSFLIALAISLSICSTSFAAEVTAQTGNATNSTQIDNSTLDLTLGYALTNIENSNTEIKLMKKKIDSLNRQYDLDHDLAVSVITNMPGVDKLQANLQETIVPLKDVQSVKDQKNAVDERINSIKFDMEKQYMNVLTCGEQIDNINKTIVNIDEKIKQLQEKIKVGQATQDSLNPLNVQKSQLLAQIDDIRAQIDQSLLTIKQYLNLDLNRNLKLTDVKKTFVKFDDSDIANKVNQAIEKDYSISKIQNNIDIAKKEQDIYSKYARNSVSGEVGAQSAVADLQTSLINTNTNLQTGLWSAYYNLKSKEQVVQTQILSEQNAKETYDKTKSNYDNGMTDKVAVDSAALALDKQKNLTQRSVNEYMVAQEEFQYMLSGHASTALSTQSIGVSGIDY